MQESWKPLKRMYWCWIHALSENQICLNTVAKIRHSELFTLNFRAQQNRDQANFDRRLTKGMGQCVDTWQFFDRGIYDRMDQPGSDFFLSSCPRSDL